MSEARIEAGDHHAQAHSHGHTALHNDSLKFGMWLFLASEVIVFTILIATYVIFSLENRDVVKEIHESTIDLLGLRLPSVFLVALNTFFLLTSSWTMVMGLREAERGNRKGLAQWITYTAALGIVFLALQYVEYGILAHEGVVIDGTGPLGEFGMRFYAPTALHGAHVLAGVLWAFWVIRQANRGAYDQNPVGVEVFGLYWHFVDVVWIAIFTVIYLI